MRAISAGIAQFALRISPESEKKASRQGESGIIANNKVKGFSKKAYTGKCAK